MLQKRIIPNLLLRKGSLVKTTQFNKFDYVGDPSNTVRIFNELEVDELIVQDIFVTSNNSDLNLECLKDLATEAFMPLSYGGGIDCLTKAKKIFDLGFEKIILNSHAVRNKKLISEIARVYGNQAIIVSIDYLENIFGEKNVYINSGKINSKLNPLKWAKEVEELGAGEILLTSISNEGTWNGFDYETISLIANKVSIPVIAHGGAGCINDISKAINQYGASAVALGSMVVYQKKDYGVLINFPDQGKIREILK